MGLVPHDIMPVGTVRPYDILLLLVVGAGFEFVTRLLLIFLKEYSANQTKKLWIVNVFLLNVELLKRLTFAINKRVTYAAKTAA